MKTVGKIIKLIVLNAIILVGCNFVGCYILDKLGFGAVGFWSMVMIVLVVLNALCVYYTLQEDWKAPHRKVSHLVELLEHDRINNQSVPLVI